MSEFQYIKATSMDDIYQHHGIANESSRILAGGTDLITQLKNNLFTLDKVIDIKDVPELVRIEYRKYGLYVGSAVSCLTARSHEAFKDYPGLVDAISLVGGIQIQGRATIGGNLCNSSPAADIIPALMVHNVTCTISSVEGTHDLPVAQFCTGPGRNVLKQNEILQALHIPGHINGFGASYQRFIPRNEMDIAVVGVAAAVQIDESKSIIEVRVALGAVAPTPLLLDIGKTLIGINISDPDLDSKLQTVAEEAKAAASPITDMRGSAEQRKHLVAVLTKRQLKKAIDRAVQSLED